MLKEEISKLEQECLNIDKGINEGLKWVINNVPAENQKAVIYNLKKYKRANERYRLALNKRPAITIFGESQVGKSYLVSNMARPADSDSLFIKDPSTNATIDFIQDINPKGGGAEATGLVTRFTVVNNYKDGQAPFLLKLLSQADIVKIFLNGYLSDIKDYQYKIDREAIQQRLQNLRNKITSQEQKGFSEDEVYEIKEYINSIFHENPLIVSLNQINIWDDIATIVPYLECDSRWEIFELFWGKHIFFTDLFKKLSSILKQMNFPKEVRCKKEGLTPNTQTIVDVQRLREMYLDETTIPPVEVYTPDGSVHKIQRSTISALTAELTVVVPPEILNDQNRKFLEQADILDFPGARSRQKIPESTFIQNSDIEKLIVVLRGKIAFLFDRYNHNLEISSLLFCMHEKQLEVKDIPSLIYNWIANNHGNSIEKREDREKELMRLISTTNVERIIPLFLVLTKFNIEMNGVPSDKLGDPSSHSPKWDARLKKNFSDEMIAPVDDKWTVKWNSYDGSFKNVFLLRDPNFSKGIYKYDDPMPDGTDYAQYLKEEYIQRIKDMKESFVTNPNVKLYFRKPEEAWNEATLPGKSGIDYIIRYLTPTCNPIIRLQQLKSLISGTKLNIFNELDAFFVGGDINEELKKANFKGAQVFMFLNKWNTETSAFGYFLDRISMLEDEAWKVYWNVQNSAVIDSKTNKSTGANTDMLVTTREMFSNYGITFDEKMSMEENLNKLKGFLNIDDKELKELLETVGLNLDSLIEGGEKIISKTEIFAENLIGAWISKVSDLKNEEKMLSKGLKKNILELIITELINNKDRVNLNLIITKNVRSNVESFSTNNNFDIVAHISASIMNDFVKSSGWIFIDEKDRPKIKDVPIYSQSNIISPSKEMLNMDIKYPGMKVFSEFVEGLRDAFKANVLFKANVKDEKNALAMTELGGILKLLKD